MCGIAGLSLRSHHPNAAPVVRRMTESIEHRGPDSAGMAQAANGRVWLGFRRLAIRDLELRANQPMPSANRRSMIVFNGEVYNSAELAQKWLPDLQLRTSGDTEVVLELLERHGLEILPELNGMFAFAWANHASGEITLGRDRMGKKPLYVYQAPTLIAFASEIRALKPFGLRPQAQRAELFFHFGYFPSPYTFFQDTTQLGPGEVMTLRDGRITSHTRFHSFSDTSWGTDQGDLEDTDRLLQDATRLRLQSDVPLGAFLSGGIDSALVASQLASLDEPAPTFTVAFADQQHNESQQAAETASQLGVPHEIIPIEAQDLVKLATDYQDCYEQPYADTSGLAAMLLCRFVKKRVTVALSGDGGDEFFGGYARYSWFRKALHAQRCPAALRQLAGSGIRRWDSRRGSRLARWLQAKDPASLYAEIICNWHATPCENILTPDAYEGRGERLVRDVFERTSGDSLAKAACFDATYYIPDDLQVKLDRASMRVSLEVRCPLLDFRVANAGIALNSETKYGDGLKSFLKRILQKHVSPSILERPKQGFAVPLARWLRGPLREFSEDALRTQTLRETSWLEATRAQDVVTRFFRGSDHLAHNVWMLLNLSHHLKPAQPHPLFASLHQRAADESTRAA